MAASTQLNNKIAKVLNQEKRCNFSSRVNLSPKEQKGRLSCWSFMLLLNFVLYCFDGSTFNSFTENSLKIRFVYLHVNLYWCGHGKPGFLYCVSLWQKARAECIGWRDIMQRSGCIKNFGAIYFEKCMDFP